MHLRTLRSLFLVTVILFAASIPASATPPANNQFTIAASNVTMPPTGLGLSKYTVSAIPIAGSMAVTCGYSGPSTTAKIPTCTYGPLAATPVTPGQTITGQIDFYPYGSAIPVDLHRSTHSPILPLAAALLLGWGLRRRAIGRLIPCVLAIAGLAAVSAISSCGGNPNDMTPGTYAYTITAGVDPTGASNPTQAASTIINVTIP
jgi:hypothetical protein